MSSPAPQKDGKPPCKVVVVGTEGQDPATVVALNQKLQGTISQFYNAARQNSDNSQGDVWHQRRKLAQGMGQLEYVSNQGMETMTIRLNPTFVEQVAKETPPEPKRLPDYCVVDIVIPSSVEVTGEFHVVGVLPGAIEGLIENDFAGIPQADYSTTVDEPLFRLAAHEPQELNVPVANRVGSILFDLRNIGETGEIVVDLYGAAYPDEYPIIDYTTGWNRTVLYGWTGNMPIGSPVVGTVIQSSTGDEIADFPGGHGTSKGHPYYYDDPHGILTTTNPRHPDLAWESVKASADIRGEVPLQQFIHAPSGEVYKERTSWMYWTETFVSSTPSDATYEFELQPVEDLREWTITEGDPTPVYGPYDVEAAITHEFFWGTPPKAAATDHRDGSGMWATTDSIPSRVQIGEAPVSSELDGPGPWSTRLIGRITVRRSAVVVDFEPAA